MSAGSVAAVAGPSVGRAMLSLLPPGPRRPGALRFSADRPGRAAADLDGRARHRAAGAGRHRLLRRRPARSRRRTWSPTRSSRSSRAGSSTAWARAGCWRSASVVFGAAMVAARRDRCRPTGRSVDVRRRGRRRRHPAADRLLRPGPLGPRARRGPPRCRPPSRSRRSSTRPSSSSARSWSRCWPPCRPGRRHRGHRGRPASAGASRSPPSAAPSRRPHPHDRAARGPGAAAVAHPGAADGRLRRRWA